MAMAHRSRITARPKPLVPEVHPDDNHAAQARGTGSGPAGNANAEMVLPLGAETGKEVAR
jgi:hypothetical protein